MDRFHNSCCHFLGGTITIYSDLTKVGGCDNILLMQEPSLGSSEPRSRYRRSGDSDLLNQLNLPTMNSAAEEPYSGTDFQHLSQTLSYQIHNPDLFEQACSPPTSVRQLEKSSLRLEFLGDAVLDLALRESFFPLSCQAEDTGPVMRAFDRLLDNDTLAEICRSRGLDLFIRAPKNPGKDILADALEAIVGAVYLDSGFDAVRPVVARLFSRESLVVPSIKEVNLDQVSTPDDTTLARFEQIFDYRFKNPRLAQQVLISDATGVNRTRAFDRLLFLGAGVLKFQLTDFLWRTYPEAVPAELTYLRRLPNGEGILAGSRGRQLTRDLQEHFQRKLRSVYRKRYLSAFLGAIYLDSQFKPGSSAALFFSEGHAKQVKLERPLPPIRMASNSNSLRKALAYVSLRIRRNPQLVSQLRKYYPGSWKTIVLRRTRKEISTVCPENSEILSITVPVEKVSASLRRVLNDVLLKDGPGSKSEPCLLRDLGDRLLELFKFALRAGATRVTSGDPTRLLCFIGKLEDLPAGSAGAILLEKILSKAKESADHPNGFSDPHQALCEALTILRRKEELPQADRYLHVFYAAVRKVVPMQSFFDLSKDVDVRLGQIIEEAKSAHGNKLQRLWKKALGTLYATAGIGYLSEQPDWHQKKVVENAALFVTSYLASYPAGMAINKDRLINELLQAPLLPCGKKLCPEMLSALQQE